jgi:hypothetical protein
MPETCGLFEEAVLVPGPSLVHQVIHRLLAKLMIPPFLFLGFWVRRRDTLRVAEEGGDRGVVCP